MPPGSVSEYQL